mgnify:CR=1 FL=1
MTKSTIFFFLIFLCYRKEAEARKQAEAEEQARRAEQRRREADALRRLQERSKAPWAQAPRTPTSATPAASLAEIQRLEREKKAVYSQMIKKILSFYAIYS